MKRNIKIEYAGSYPDNLPLLPVEELQNIGGFICEKIEWAFVEVLHDYKQLFDRLNKGKSIFVDMIVKTNPSYQTISLDIISGIEWEEWDNSRFWEKTERILFCNWYGDSGFWIRNDIASKNIVGIPYRQYQPDKTCNKSLFGNRGYLAGFNSERSECFVGIHGVRVDVFEWIKKNIDVFLRPEKITNFCLKSIGWNDDFNRVNPNLL